MLDPKEGFTSSNRRPLLRRLPYFSELGDSEALLLGQSLRPRSLRTDEVLYRQGDPGQSLVICLEGRLSVQIRGAGGEGVEICQVSPWGFTGEMSAIDPAPRTATVVAYEPSTLLELSRQSLVALQHRCPLAAAALVGGVIEQITHRLRETGERLKEEIERYEAGLPSHGPLRAPVRDVPHPPAPKSGLAFLRAPALPPPPRRGPAPRRYQGPLDLHRISALEGLLSSDLEVLSTKASAQVFPPSAELCHEGEPGSSCFLIVQGEVEVRREMEAGPRPVATLGPGAFLGQMALVDNGPRSATVVARGEVLALEIDRALFTSLFSTADPMGVRFQELVAVAGIRQLRMADARLSTILSVQRSSSPGSGQPRPEGRYEHYRTALTEWSISLEDLDDIEVFQPAGLPRYPKTRPPGR